MPIVGAIDVACALATVVTYLGYRVTVVDAPVFATRELVRDVEDIVVARPDAYLATTPADARTAIVILKHDVTFDIPFIEVALASGVGSIVAMRSGRAGGSLRGGALSVHAPPHEVDDDVAVQAAAPIEDA